MTPESFQELQRLMLTKQPGGAVGSTTPDVGSITPMSPYEAIQAQRSQLSSDPVIATLQKFGRGIKGLLTPESAMDYASMAVPFGKAGTIITKPVYHATDKVFDTFKKSKGKRGMGVSFAIDPNNAKVYGKNLKELDISKAKLWDFRNKNDVNKLIKEISEQHKIAVKNPYTNKGTSFYPFSLSDVKKGIKKGNAYYLEMDGVSNAMKKLQYDGHIGLETLSGRGPQSFWMQGKVFEPDLIKIKKQ